MDILGYINRVFTWKRVYFVWLIGTFMTEVFKNYFHKTKVTFKKIVSNVY
jgi:hypothetical protein